MWWVAALAAFVLSGCASTRITQVWKDPSADMAMRRNVVIAVDDAGEGVRRFAEDAAVRAILPGTRAVASYTLFERLDPDGVRTSMALGGKGFDALIMARLVSVDRRNIQFPPERELIGIRPVLVMPPGATHPVTIWVDEYAYAPGRIVEVSTAVVETTMFTVPEGKRIWYALTETDNAGSTPRLVEEVVTALRGRLQADGMIAPAASVGK